VDLASDSVIANVKVGVRPWGLALLPDGSRLYVANGPSGDVSVINTATRQVARTISTGELPWGAAVGHAARQALSARRSTQ
jgi:YVTN family beta-propeller protein